MYSKVLSGLVRGVEGMLISVETDIHDGLPMMNMVGYLSACVREAGDRTSQFQFQFAAEKSHY